MSSRCPRCLSKDETAAHIYRYCNEDAIKQRKADWKELQKQLTKIRTSSIILHAWNEHLLPLLALPSAEDIIINLLYASVSDTAANIDGMGETSFRPRCLHMEDLTGSY